ncbi:GIY-YIG nuclease family protein [Methylobacterium sp. Gmos1]
MRSAAMGSAKPAYLYVIADGAGAHKVGLSTSPQKRLRQLQTASPKRLSLVRTSEEPEADAGAIEAYAHWLLREAQEDGEWFSVTEEAAWVAVVAATEAVARGERAPPRARGGHSKGVVIPPYVPMCPAEFKQHRKALGLTQSEAAQMLGVHRVTLADWERGQPPVPVAIGRLLRLMVLRGISADELPPYEAGAPSQPISKPKTKPKPPPPSPTEGG